MWLLAAVLPGILWLSAARPRPEQRTAVGGIGLAGWTVTVGSLHSLFVAAVADLAGISLRAAAVVWTTSLVPPLLLAVRRRGLFRRVGLRDPLVAWTLLVTVLLLGIWMARAPVPLEIGSDGPAHVGGIRDALQSDRLRPLDHSFDERSRRSDPRFGIAHGFYGLQSLLSGQDPLQVWAQGPIALAPLYFLAHAWLFATLGLPIAWAVIASLLFTIGGAGGRGFGVWSAGYPAQAAIALSMLGLAAWLRTWTPARALEPPAASRRRWVGPALVGASVLLHPLGWVCTMGVVTQTILLRMLRGTSRKGLLRELAPVAGAFALGTLLLLPRLSERAAAVSGLHGMVTDAAFVGRHLFVVDPLVLVNWCGWGAVWALPVALLAAPWLWSRPRALTALGGAALVWTVSFNPVVQPLAWKAVGYLSVRLGRMAWTPALWMLVIGGGIATFRARRTRTARMAGTLGALVAGALLLREVGTTWRVARASAPGGELGLWQQFAEMRRAVDALPGGRVAADPRTSYALRALRGGPMPIYPVAHASPTDAGLPERLAAYRSLFSPACDHRCVIEALQALDARYLLVHERVESISGAGDFGYVPSDAAQHALGRWLQQAGVEPRARGDGWTMFAVDDLVHLAPSESTLAEPPGMPPKPAVQLATPVLGSRFAIVALHALERQVDAGQPLRVRIWYEARPGPARTVHPDWESVSVRFEGPSLPVPAAFEWVSKLYRKFVVEDSGRSLARFRGAWIPFDGTWPPQKWPPHPVSEVRTVRVPPHVRPGIYSMQLTVQEAPWRERNRLGDYLRDQDRWSGPVVGQVGIGRATDADRMSPQAPASAVPRSATSDR